MKKKSIQVRRVAVLVMAFIMITTMLAGLNINAASFSGSGKGTKKSPYLVTNAQQLDEIRHNLNANYKLANNIDMSSIANFKPIGGFNAPFKGTFSCDTAGDGKPKYIIKNLTVKVSPVGATLAEKYSGYKEDGSMGWEAGLFGCVNGATFKNIVVLNANVTSTVEGNSSMNSDWSINEGQSLEQSTGILIGTAINTTVTGCGSSGTVTSSSNNVGGLIGTITATDGKTSTLKNSYSYANVTSTGKWNSGGLCGSKESYWGKYNGKLTVESCFYQGTFSGSYTNAGAFFGAVHENDVIKNCWASGTVVTSSSGCFFATDVYGSGIPKNTEVCENCYTTAVIQGRTKAQTNKTVVKNNWITDAPGGLELGFAAGSMDEINNAFSGLSAWTVAAGTYPQLKDVYPITSPDGYNPLTESDSSASLVTGSESLSSGEETVTTSESGEISEDGVEETVSQGKISTTVKNTNSGTTLAEKILFIVLIVIIAILVAATVFVLVKWFVLTNKYKKAIGSGTSADLLNNAYEDLGVSDIEE